MVSLTGERVVSSAKPLHLLTVTVKDYVRDVSAEYSRHVPLAAKTDDCRGLIDDYSHVLNCF